MSEKINIFIVSLPTLESVVEKIKNTLDDVTKTEKPKFSRPSFTCDFEDDEVEDLTPKYLRIKKPCGNVQPWGIGGKKADENLRFGAAFEVDEPRASDYDCRWEFEDDHKAFDRFVDAGEDCVARGLARPEGVVAHKCNAIRKPIGCPPPMKDEVPSELIGETDWFDQGIDWPY